MLLGSFAGKAGRQAAAVLGLILVAAWAVLFGWSTWALVKGIDPARVDEARPVLVRLVFLGTFLMQLMTSILSLSVSDFFDTARLMHLPVRARSIFFAMLVSSVLSPSTLVFAAPAIGAIAALPGSPELYAFRGVVVLALVLFGQAIALFFGYLLLGALSRRRLRDAATILGSVLGLAFYIFVRMVRPEALIGKWIASGPLGVGLGFTPTSVFADLAASDHMPSFGVLVVVPSLLALAGSFALGAWAFTRFYSRAGESSEAPPPAMRSPVASRFLPTEIAAMVRQTLAVIWREPQLKAMLFQQMVFLVVPFVFLPRRGEPGGEGNTAMWSVPFFMVFSHGWLALSLLGVDGSGLKLLLQSPAPRWRVLLGRSFALGWLFAIIDVAAMGLLFLVSALWARTRQPLPQFMQLLVACLVADWFLVGAGALISVLLPSPLIRRGKHLRMRQEGCATNLGKVVLRLPVMIFAVIAGIITAFPAIFPRIDPIWYFVSIPSGLLITAAVATVAIAYGAKRLVASEERILAVLADAGD